ncbi:MAG: prephenate dehydrogenase/arogenate dehydrogenase family protein [Candidatus Ranarchaeia archaeon]
MKPISTIIGGYGKIGKWLWPILEKQGYEILIHSRSMRDSPYNYVKDFDTAIERSDLIVVSTPIPVTPRILEKIADNAAVQKKKPLIFEVSSIKTPLVHVFQKLIRKKMRIVATHPLCGLDTPPADASVLIMDLGDETATKAVKHIFDLCGASTHLLPLEDHDPLMAILLGLPHIVNHLYLGVMSELGYADLLGKINGTSFTAQTSIASVIANEDPDLYFHLLAGNPYIPEVLRKIGLLNDSIKKHLVDDNKAFQQNQGLKFFRDLMEKNKNFVKELGIDISKARSFFVSAPKP